MTARSRAPGAPPLGRPRAPWPYRPLDRGRRVAAFPGDRRDLAVRHRDRSPTPTVRARVLAAASVPSRWTIRELVCYRGQGRFGDQEIREALDACVLEHLTERLEDSRNWALELSSSGALPWRACLLHRPTWLFLNEATSAVEPALGERLLCPSVTVAKTTLLSIGHRRELALHHDLVSIAVSGGLSTSARGSRRGLEQPGV